MWQQLPDGRVSHPFEPLLLALTLLVIPVVLVEEAGTPHGVKVAAYITNWVIWLGFLAELVFVLVVADRKGAALRAYWLEALLVVGTHPSTLGCSPRPGSFVSHACSVSLGSACSAGSRFA